MGCNSDRVTIHYYGTITVPDTGSYSFKNIADDGFFMTINGQVVIDEWRDKGCNGNWGAPITLTAGTAYTLDAWFYENGGGACSTLYVTQPSSNWQVTPAAWFGAATTTTYIKDPALLAILEQKLAALKDAQAALSLLPPLTINAPTQLTASVDGSTVTLNWSAPTSGLIPERYAIMWSDGKNGWGIATGNVGDANALNTSISFNVDIVGSSGGWDKSYTFSIRSDHDSGHAYSSWSNQATLTIVKPGPTPEQLAAEAARLEAEKQAAIAAQLAAEAAAEAARLEALRVANEQAAAAAAAESARQAAIAAEAARVAAEAEAARQAAIAAESARVAAEAAAKAEADRLAAEEAARIQAEKDRLAAEAAAQAEADRVAAEKAAAEAEAARLAAEAEAKAQAEAAAKAEADRLAAEAEAKAQAEAAAKAEAERIAAEEAAAKAEADRVAAEEAAAKAEAEAAAKAEEKRLAEEAAAKAEAEAKAAEAEAAAKDKELKDAAKEGTLTEEQKQEVANNLIEEANGGPVSAAAIAEAGIEYKDLPPETPVEVRQDENGNEVIITADVAAALVLLENPAELIGELFSDPGQALKALGSIGADMSPQEREEAQKMVVAAVIAGNAAINAVAVAGTAGGTTSGGSTGGGGGNSGGGGASGESKGIRRRKP